MRRCAASAVEPTRRQWQPHTLTSAHAPTPSGSPIRRQARRFCEADIEQILETAVESPIYGAQADAGSSSGGVGDGAPGGGGGGGGSGGGGGGAAAAKGGLFSRASFQPDGKGQELRLDDPAFWTKLQELLRKQDAAKQATRPAGKLGGTPAKPGGSGTPAEGRRRKPRAGAETAAAAAAVAATGGRAAKTPEPRKLSKMASTPKNPEKNEEEDEEEEEEEDDDDDDEEKEEEEDDDAFDFDAFVDKQPAAKRAAAPARPSSSTASTAGSKAAKAAPRKAAHPPPPPPLKPQPPSAPPQPPRPSSGPTLAPGPAPAAAAAAAAPASSSSGRAPILEEWSMLEDGRFRGRVYGKAGVTEGKWVITSHVPPERRDLPARCVWTDSGSTYRLGQKARG